MAASPAVCRKSRISSRQRVIGLAQLGAHVDLGDAGGDAPGDVIVLDAAAAVEHQGHVQRFAQLGDALDVQLGGGLFLVQQVVGDGPVHAAHGHAQPVAAALLREAHGVVHLGEAQLAGEDLLIGDGLLAGLVAHDRAQLGLHRYAGGVGDVGHGPGGGDVARQVQSGAVHHHALVARGDGPLDEGQVIHLQVILVDHRHVVQVQQRVALHGVLAVFPSDVLQADGFKFFPLQPGDLYHRHAVLVDDGLDDGLEHRGMGDVEGRHHQPVFQRLAHNQLCVHG